MPEPLAYVLVASLALVLALLLPFSFHRAHLLWISARRPDRCEPRTWEGDLPFVTIQLPVYNELLVVRRLIDAACRVDYPRDRLEIQVLDDSTDRTSAVVAERVRTWRSRGVRIRHLRRGARAGYKAGALAHGLAHTRAEFLVVLDADFVAQPNLVHRLLPPFRDPRVGMVQARWEHLNEEESWLTRGQALLLDGHFLFEQYGRYTAGRFLNFNGTAGMWRRRCLEDAGGWQADTLTEDLDVSYRAQMRGWRFVFLADYAVPSELPADVGAFEVQQRRWSQGAIQTARKLLPALLRGPWPWPVKLEAVAHLCGHLAYPLTLALGLLLYPSALARQTLGWHALWGIDIVLFAAATVPFAAFYCAAGRRRGHGWEALVPRVAVALATGLGLTAPVSRAVLRGLLGRRDAFLRTPKRGDARRRRTRYSRGSGAGDTALKLALGATMAGYAVAAVAAGLYGSLPFILLFASGYLALGLGGLRGAALATERRSRVATALAPAAANAIVDEQQKERRPDGEARPEWVRPQARAAVLRVAPVGEEDEPAEEEPWTTLPQRRDRQQPEHVPRVDGRREDETRAQNPEQGALRGEARERGAGDDAREHDRARELGGVEGGQDGGRQSEETVIEAPVAQVGAEPGPELRARREIGRIEKHGRDGERSGEACAA
ncbi:MAG: glycosyltransferase [Gemmatimonadetes bacterium]|nr:glycosyltransferase [Gemmatimonadota bacterium]